ncbi:MAG: YdhR family protein [Acidobacteriota bacterium]
MVTVIVQFKVGDAKVEALKEAFAASVPKFQQVPGLLRKYYLLSDDGETAGGVYLWKSRADAEALYTHEWKQMLEEKYGSEPVLSYFESPVIVDNQYGETYIE